MKVEQIIKCVSCKTRCKYRQFSWKKSKKSEKKNRTRPNDVIFDNSSLLYQLKTLF
jgi:hypothetical protein